MAERTGRIVANDTRESVILDAATFLDTFRDNIWEELGILIHVPLSSYKEDFIPLSKSHAVMTFFGQVIEMNGFAPSTTAILKRAIGLVARAPLRGADVWIVL